MRRSIVHPPELTAWIQAVVSGRPRHEQEDAKRDLAAWINLNISVTQRAKYQKTCMDLLVQALDAHEVTTKEHAVGQ